MAEPTLLEVFGTGATRLADGETVTEGGLFIPDSVLMSGGLADPTVATAEGHLTVLLLNAQSNLSETNFNSNLDQSVYISSGFPNFSSRGENSTQYRVDQLTVNFARLDDSSTIEPDNY